MAIYDSILFIEIFLLICLILILIILYNYLTKYRDKVGELLFDYIIYPFFTLLLIGILLHIYDFKYITQYITVCGPILSACVAIYVSSRNENIQKNKEVSKKLDYFEFNIEILDICNKAIKQELKNYETLTSIFKKPNLELPTLTSTPFDFLNLFMKAPQHEVLAAFIETKIHDKEKLKQIYITIAKNVSNAIFVKQKAEQSYSEFIKTYNVSANKLRDAIQAINSLYRNDCEPYKNEIFCNRFRKFIHTYNTKLQNSEISFYNLNDIENEFMKPLKAVLAHADMAKSISHQLIHEHENLSISLDKINELKDFLINNFEHYINAMRDISEVIESNSKLIK